MALSPLRPPGIRVVSFVWGICEATFFFFVPDIWLTRIAATDLKEAVINALIALSGALLGGVLLYVLSQHYFDNIRSLLDYVPAISETMVDEAGRELQGSHPLSAIILAGFTGVPFKIYAAWAGHLDISFPHFLLACAVARLGRFFAVIFAAYLIISAVRSRVEITGLFRMHAVLWGLFYCFYFYSVGL